MALEAFICGYKGRRIEMPWNALTKAERKALRNFSQYLRGEGSRCPICLHRADKHHRSGCGGKDCDCRLSEGEVRVARERAQAPEKLAE